MRKFATVRAIKTGTAPKRKKYPTKAFYNEFIYILKGIFMQNFKKIGGGTHKKKLHFLRNLHFLGKKKHYRKKFFFMIFRFNVHLSTSVGILLISS